MRRSRWFLDPFPSHVTLAFRLVVLFTLGSALLITGITYLLYHALKIQLDERELAEVRGKTAVIRHLLEEIPDASQLDRNLGRFRDIAVGHPHITVGISQAEQWLLPPARLIQLRIQQQWLGAPTAAEHIVRWSVNDAEWWVIRLRHQWPTSRGAAIDIYLAVEVEASRVILRQHGLVALLAVVLGVLASGLLAFFVTQRGLAPIADIAANAERMTADRLSAPLDIAHAPGEIRSLVESLNRMLERLSDSFRSLEQFSADIAHELRTPLNNLMLQTQVTLSRPRAVAEYQETLLSNLEELERLQRMVSDMLFLARADRGMLPIEFKPVDLRQEADSLAEFFELTASEREQTLAVAGHAVAQGDRLMLRRAMTNLLSNAVRYAPPGAHIAVELHSDGDGARLTVCNPDPASSTMDWQQAFVRFSRGDSARTRDTDGVGLGLAIVDSIMRLHAGWVEVQSEAGQVCFSLYFPPHLPGAANESPLPG